jgi:hypothetical protein
MVAGLGSFVAFTLPIQPNWSYVITGASIAIKYLSEGRKGKPSTGWFYGLKLFLVINAFGEIMNAFFHFRKCCGL